MISRLKHFSIITLILLFCVPLFPAGAADKNSQCVQCHVSRPDYVKGGFPASEAKGLGLVNRVVSLDTLEATTFELAHGIAEASGFALSIGKQGFYAQADMTDAQAFHYGKQTIVMNNCSDDAQNGIAAFLEKKTPEWTNR